MKTILPFLLLFFCAFSNAQTTAISGTVVDDNGQPLPGANIIVSGTSTGTVTDFDGAFNLNVSQNPPFSVQASMIGFSTATIEVTTNNQVLNFVLNEGTSLDEVVISASRTPERIFESPVTVERLGLKEIKNTASADFYDGLENLKGVDIHTNSLTFKSVNTRGFSAFANNRFMQLVDGMDNSTPALNFPIGNLVGMTETDVLSVELLPGASSALYGANAFNGILFMRSKNPFDHPGISASLKGGVTSQEAAGNNQYVDYSIRLAHKFSNKFAAKVNFGYLKGTDWVANSEVDQNSDGGSRTSNLNYNGINIYGDEVSQNLKSVAFALESAINPATGQPYLPAGANALVPSVRVSRTGYSESDLTDYEAKSVKADWGLYFRPWENDFEISYVGKIGTGTTLYQGLNRYNIENFFQEQHKLELRNENFFLRGYVVADKAGDSYDMVFTGININRAWKPDLNWFAEYAGTYVLTTLGGGTDAQAHEAARIQAEDGRFLPGSDGFKAAFNKSINDPDLRTGSKFQDASKYYHADANYNFSHLIDFADIQVGGSYRQYNLNSFGTIYTDTPENGPIDYSEYGIYTQIQKSLALSEDLNLKLTGSIRYDKSKFFDGFLSPRISAGLTVNRNHNIRASVQTGFRNPTTQDLFIGLDANRAILVGAAPENLERYSRDYPANDGNTYNQTGAAAYNNSYSENSVLRYQATGNQSDLLVSNPDLVKPEQVTSAEVGYRGKFNKLIIDFSAYYNSYKDFISQQYVISPLYGTAGDASGVEALNRNDYITYNTYTNSEANVNSYGASIGVSTKVLGNFDLGGSYTYTKLDFDQDAFPDFVTNFNTPEHKFKASFGNTNLFKNFGFNINYRFSDDYFWENTFATGLIPEYHVLDAQINLRVPSFKSTFKIGATNLLGDEYFSAIGTGHIGSMYYLSWTINNL
ncbi:TonB-dependent receptor [Gelatiniphilus marinus]|uniref:TonB-dependent receptor n=1 Tax=Gelatiniphilus marinus TaxID=1759464 RepID=A0ABW5JQL9_9FLAO